ncbi:MAG: hypothetical protein EA420_07980 [Candidatus Competibacteraceae bacterium]|nr:MAG: hypothetical protein EA420_07980 [Candidatus Competibacteraceae bacterium]
MDDRYRQIERHLEELRQDRLREEREQQLREEREQQLREEREDRRREDRAEAVPDRPGSRAWAMFERLWLRERWGFDAPYAGAPRRPRRPRRARGRRG